MYLILKSKKRDLDPEDVCFWPEFTDDQIYAHKALSTSIVYKLDNLQRVLDIEITFKEKLNEQL